MQSVKQQRVIDAETVNAIPGSRMYHNLVVLVPGLSTGGQNVGGINGPAPLLVGGHGGNGPRDGSTSTDSASMDRAAVDRST